MTTENVLLQLRRQIAIDDIKYMLGRMSHNSAIKIASRYRDFWHAACGANYNHYKLVVEILEEQALSHTLNNKNERSTITEDGPVAADN